ncbi:MULTISPECIES: hypothetical protein [Streptomyces]|uniref:hypothetical protein n=1 Tax=Streptomyces TaxID=1883 RepID=UPI0004C6A4AC|nr:MULTISPECIES: hypothetical protein [Streptomyces]RPK92909.1 hypothetical protein EES46_07385 [Streptomyces sp. ADI98-10]
MGPGIAAQLAAMADATLIDTSRGSLVDGEALLPRRNAPRPGAPATGVPGLMRTGRYRAY